MECISCHVGGFGPQLTPRGIRFKLGGYSDTGGTGPAANVPLSAMIVGSFTHLAKGLTEDPGPNDGKNNNGSLQEVSAFLAGRLFDHAGSFTQVTYSDIDNKVVLDAVDLHPGRMPGRTDQYDDVGVDGSYRFLPNRHHQFAVNTAYIHERRKLNGSFGAEDAAHSSGTFWPQRAGIDSAAGRWWRRPPCWQPQISGTGTGAVLRA